MKTQPSILTSKKNPLQHCFCSLPQIFPFSFAPTTTQSKNCWCNQERKKNPVNHSLKFSFSLSLSKKRKRNFDGRSRTGRRIFKHMRLRRNLGTFFFIIESPSLVKIAEKEVGNFRETSCQFRVLEIYPSVFRTFQKHGNTFFILFSPSFRLVCCSNWSSTN